MSDKITKTKFTIERFARQVTWGSTSNPYFTEVISVAKSGKTAIGVVGYYAAGTYSSFIYVPVLHFIDDSQRVDYALRMNGTPASTTQNTFTIVVLYVSE